MGLINGTMYQRVSYGVVSCTHCIKLTFVLLQITKAREMILEVDSELADALEDIKEYTGKPSGCKLLIMDFS